MALSVSFLGATSPWFSARLIPYSLSCENRQYPLTREEQTSSTYITLPVERTCSVRKIGDREKAPDCYGDRYDSIVTQDQLVSRKTDRVVAKGLPIKDEEPPPAS